MSSGRRTYRGRRRRPRRPLLRPRPGAKRGRRCPARGERRSRRRRFFRAAGRLSPQWGPNTVRPTPELWTLVEELGLSAQALLADPRMPRFVDWGGRLHPVPMSPGSMATTRLLSPGGKLRVLREPFVRSRGAPDESLRDFVVRRLGREVAERFVEPVVSGIFAGDSTRLDAAQAFPALARLERDHGSILWGAIASRRKTAAQRAKAPRGLLSFPDGLTDPSPARWHPRSATDSRPGRA